MLEPRPVGWGGGELSDSGSTTGDEKQWPLPRLSFHASGAPPPNAAENDNNMTIRRIYDKIDVTSLHAWTGGRYFVYR